MTEIERLKIMVRTLLENAISEGINEGGYCMCELDNLYPETYCIYCVTTRTENA